MGRITTTPVYFWEEVFGGGGDLSASPHFWPIKPCWWASRPTRWMKADFDNSVSPAGRSIQPSTCNFVTPSLNLCISESLNLWMRAFVLMCDICGRNWILQFNTNRINWSSDCCCCWVICLLEKTNVLPSSQMFLTLTYTMLYVMRNISCIQCNNIFNTT